MGKVVLSVEEASHAANEKSLANGAVSVCVSSDDKPANNNEEY